MSGLRPLNSAKPSPFLKKPAFLYLLTPPDIIDPDILIPMVRDAVCAGADIIQLRNKLPEVTTRRLIEVGGMVRNAVRQEGGLFIVNNRIDIAIATGADGVHLGQEDLPIHYARRIFGEAHRRMIIGISTHSIEQAIEAESEGADYIGFGPVFPTPAKEGYPPLGVGSFSLLNEKLSIPYFAIGGITLSNVDSVLDAGASRVALSQGIFGQKERALHTKRLKEKLLSYSQKRGRQ